LQEAQPPILGTHFGSERQISAQSHAFMYQAKQAVRSPAADVLKQHSPPTLIESSSLPARGVCSLYTGGASLLHSRRRHGPLCSLRNVFFKKQEQRPQSRVPRRRITQNRNTKSMKKILTIGAAALLLVGATMLSPASAAKSRRHHTTQGVTPSQGMTTASGRTLTGGNAALKGNNGNSGQGDNSLGNIKGGNVGAGK
jgi:hypothetical protein